jgi:cellulose synthase/poly-beta-1,6-N-acetylglucosamine synthase-like glycosyltransferase|tara:strand:- start:1870 stop:2091 length:222 start_codon:yes stop_codon:yes gene_type:complete
VKVSVVIAAYNCEKSIQKALNSVPTQTFPSKEYEIIVDNMVLQTIHSTYLKNIKIAETIQKVVGNVKLNIFLP